MTGIVFNDNADIFATSCILFLTLCHAERRLTLSPTYSKYTTNMQHTTLNTSRQNQAIISVNESLIIEYS